MTLGGYFDESAFLEKLEKGINQVKKVLGAERNPKIAPDVAHRWIDKFALADYTISTTASSILESLKKLGLSDSFIQKNLEKNFKSKTVTLALKGARECVLIAKEERVEKSDSVVVEKTTAFGVKKQEKTFVESIVVEWKWKVVVSWRLSIYLGNNEKECEVLKEHTGSFEMKTLNDQAPYPEKFEVNVPSVDLSSLFSHITPAGLIGVQIDRTDVKCLTPSRNPQAEEAILLASNLKNWCEVVDRFLHNYCFSSQAYSSTKFDISCIFSHDSILLASLPLMQDDSSRPTFDEDANRLLNASFASVEEKIQSLHKTFPNDNSIISQKEAELGFLTAFINLVSANLCNTLNYLERLIDTQIREALGRHVDPNDFDEYMRYQNRTFFNTLYTPKPFCYPVRRPAHVPEGTLSLEQKEKPIQTIVSSTSDPSSPMFFTLDESTRVIFKGKKHVHGFLRTVFEDSPSIQLQLTARARQFSSYILLIGKLVGKDQFEPEDAIVLQNKDHILVTLLSEVIPSAKQFKEAISSLSPEQQRFAQAFRSMQLSSTLFAVCVLQIKPALEKVLNLPPDSLTKEIQLTQDLMKLFIEFQIPSDLLSYDALLQTESQSVTDKVSIVKKNTEEMLKIIQKEKDSQLKGLAEKFVVNSLDSGSVHRSMQMDDGMMKQQSKMMLEEPIMTKKVFKKSAKRAENPAASSGFSFSAPATGFAPPVSQSAPSPPSPSYSAAELAPQSAGYSPSPSFSAAAPSPFSGSNVNVQVNNVNVSSLPDYQNIGRQEKGSLLNDEEEEGIRDFAKIPSQLDNLFEKYDKDGSVRPTILSTGEWVLKSYPSLLGNQKTTCLGADGQKQQKQKAFDLIDALTKSGAIEIDDCDLHVIIAVTHNFQKALMAILGQENVNPIEKVQSSTIILASCIHNMGEDFSKVVSATSLEKVKEFCPQLKL